MPKLDLSDLRQRDVEAFYRASRDIRTGLSNVTPEAYSEQIVKFVANLHKAAGDMEAESLQATVREFSNGLLLMSQRRDTFTSTEVVGVTVRAMARLGWLGEDVSEDDVGDMRPGDVTAFSDQFNALLEAAYEIPKN